MLKLNILQSEKLEIKKNNSIYNSIRAINISKILKQWKQRTCIQKVERLLKEIKQLNKWKKYPALS